MPQTPKKDIHIGEKIRQRARKVRMGPTELGRLVGTSKQNIYGIYKRKSIDTDLLIRLSKALEFDFFNLYSDRAKPEVKLVNRDRIRELAKGILREVELS